MKPGRSVNVFWELGGRIAARFVAICSPSDPGSLGSKPEVSINVAYLCKADCHSIISAVISHVSAVLFK